MPAIRDAGGQEMTMQVWEAESGCDLLVLREVLALAERDPQVAAVVLSALYEQRSGDGELNAILAWAEVAPLDVKRHTS
jgi:hypothetical protein